MSIRFFTNAGENTLLNKFAGVFAHNPDLARFDALVGYLRASGYFALQPHLEKVPLIRILVGIDVRSALHRINGNNFSALVARRGSLVRDVD